MVDLEMKSPTVETSANTSNNSEETMSDYEQCRQKRIQENMERMRKLGLFHLSSQFNSQISSSKKRTFQKKTSPKSSPLPPRRSSRLQNTPSVNYAENSKMMIELEDRVDCGEMGTEEEHCDRNCGDEQDRRPMKRVRSCGDEQDRKPEIYTEEHEKLLGSCESSWNLSDDNGRRVYDQVNGKSCHQCRQKTLGYRTTCSRCIPTVQGQFCGDCLYLRYGENLFEANQNPNWICPPCRGICNCSLCRHAKGWPPTGPIHKMVVSLGYKSVAHYLIKTRRAENVKDSEQGLQVMSGDGKQVTPKPLHKEITLYYTRRRFGQRKNATSEHSGGEKDESGNKSEVVLGGDVSICTSEGKENEFLSEINELQGKSLMNQLLKDIASVNLQLKIGKGGGGKKMPQWKAQMVVPRFTREDREPLINLLPKGLKRSGGEKDEPRYKSVVVLGGDVSICTSEGRENECLSEINELQGESPMNQLLKEIASVNLQLKGKGGGGKKMPQWKAQMVVPRFTREDREPLINLLPKGSNVGKRKR